MSILTNLSQFDQNLNSLYQSIRIKIRNLSVWLRDYQFFNLRKIQDKAFLNIFRSEFGNIGIGPGTLRNFPLMYNI